MAIHLGNYNTSGTRTMVRYIFSTHDAAGANVAPSSAFEAADIRIYRANDSADLSATQRSSAAGITMTSPFDSLTGVHAVSVDLTDNTDSGFFSSGYFYYVVLAPDETVDSQTITGIVLCSFEIGVPSVNVTQFGGTNGTFSGGRPQVNTSHVAGTAQTAGDIVSYLEGIILYKGTIHSSGNDTTHIVFTSATLADDSIIDNMLVIEDTSGNVKECKWVIDWDLATATATLDSALSFTPEASNDRYWLMNIKRNVNVVDIDPTITTEIVDAVVARFSDDTGTAQAGGSTTITLRSGAVATNDYYNGAVVNIYGGTGEGQSRRITGYVGSTRVATVASAWVTNPDSSSTYFVIGRIA